jgi:O-antigen/teichoic acid export membrane protein
MSTVQSSPAPPEASIRSRSVKAIALTGLMLAGQMLAYLFAVRQILASLGTEAFGTFQLLRQVVTFATPVLLVGLNVALVQRLGYARGNPAGEQQAMLATALVAAVAWCVVAALRASDAGWLSGLLLSRPEAEAAHSLLGLLGAVLAFNYVYAIYRGRQQFLVASALQAVCFGAVPLLFVFYYRESGVYVITNGIAGAILLVSAAALAAQLAAFGRRPVPVAALLKRELGTQLHYGMRRMFVPLLLGAMMTLGPIALTHAGLAGEAGAYLVALVVFRAVDPALTIVAVVMLPMLSQASAYRHARAADYARLALHVTMGVGGFVCVFGALLAGWLATTFFGPREIADPLRVVVLALPFSMYLLLAQPLIDATTAKAVVLRALFIAFIVNAAAVAAALRWAPYGVTLAAALGTGYAVAALVVWRHVSREFGLRLPWRELAKIGSVLLAVALPSWLLLALAGPNAWSGAVVALGAPAAYWVLSKLVHARWCLEAEALLRSPFKNSAGQMA